MKVKLAAAACAITMFFLGVLVGRTQLLSKSVIIKPQKTESMSMAPLIAKPSQAEAKDNKVNINTADATELAGLPGIGETLAARIIEYREKNGDFESLEEIMAVNGIGAGKYDSIKEYIKLK